MSILKKVRNLLKNPYNIPDIIKLIENKKKMLKEIEEDVVRLRKISKKERLKQVEEELKKSKKKKGGDIKKT